MTDIVERLLATVRDETQVSGTLNREAAEAITELREENRKLKKELEQYRHLAEPEF